MNVQKLTATLQDYCHQGKSLDEVEILDSDGNTICELDDVSLIRDHDREVVQIKIHHKKSLD